MQSDNWRIRIMVAALTHGLYFVVGTALCYAILLFLCLRLGILSLDGNPMPSYEDSLLGSWGSHRPLFIAAAILGLIIGIAGPFLYMSKVMRDRGRLEEVRHGSRYTGPQYLHDEGLEREDEDPHR